jgi:hypothetical protein
MADTGKHWIDELRISRARIVYRPLLNWRLSEQPDVMFRGALGAAVLQGVCVRRDRDCSACLVRDDCLVPHWYDPSHGGESGPRPFVISTRTEGGAQLSPTAPLEVELTLVRPCPRPSAMIEALVRSGRHGLGPKRVPHRLERLSVHADSRWVLVIEDERQLTPWPEPATLSNCASVPPDPAGVSIDLYSPLQLKSTRKPRPQDIIDACIQRVRSVARLQGADLQQWWPDLDGLPGGWEDQRLVESSRYSRAQGSPVDMSGWRGTLHLGPEAMAYRDVIAAAELLHIGRKTSAGLGKLRARWR